MLFRFPKQISLIAVYIFLDIQGAKNIKLLGFGLRHRDLLEVKEKVITSFTYTGIATAFRFCKSNNCEK